MLGGDERRQLAHDQLRRRAQVALALEHPGDPREVGLQPVLLHVPWSSREVGDHLVDVVLELGDLALASTLIDRRQVALGHRGRHLGDRADLGREVAELSDNINQMIQNLRETTRVNAEEDWLKTNLARISGMLQGQRDLQAVTQLIMSEVTPVVAAQHGAFFLVEHDGGGHDAEGVLRLIASYGYRPQPGVPDRFRLGEGLVGQAAFDGEPIRLPTSPTTTSRSPRASGEAKPSTIQVMPIMFEEQVLGVIELGVAAAARRGQPGVPRPAHRHDRGRDQHDPGEHAHGGAAVAVAGADAGAPEAVRGAAPDQRRAPGQGGPALPAEPRHRDQERARSSSPAAASRRRPRSSRCPRSTSPSSWRT